MSVEEIIGFVLDGHLPLVVYCPTGTRQSAPQGWGSSGLVRPTVEGLWDVELEGERGKPARQHLEHLRNPQVSLDGVQGAWIKRANDKRESGYDYQQLEPQRREGGIYPTSPAAFPRGCELGVRREALDALLAEKGARGERDKSESVPAEWKDVTIRFVSDNAVQIKIHKEMLEPTNYKELGFEDTQRDQPIKAWETFRQLGEAEPTRLELPPKKKKTDWKDSTGDTDRVATQNRMKRSIRDSERR